MAMVTVENQLLMVYPVSNGESPISRAGSAVKKREPPSVSSVCPHRVLPSSLRDRPPITTLQLIHIAVAKLDTVLCPTSRGVISLSSTAADMSVSSHELNGRNANAMPNN